MIGTLQNFETRLLFSSAQVEYIRAWLHATKLTKTMIPIPYSDCLLTESNLKNVSPIYFSDGGELRNSIKVRSPKRSFSRYLWIALMSLENWKE